MKNNGNNESRMRKLLFNEISFIFALAGVIIGIVLFVTQPDAEMKQDIALIKQDISAIKNNELVHIQDSITINRQVNQEIIKRVDEIEKCITRLETLLGEHMGE
jgi:hypothetical protein